MSVGEYQIAKQIGGKGYYGQLVLDVCQNDSGDLRIHFDPSEDDPWRRGIEFGVQYAWDQVPKATPRSGMTVNVKEVRVNPVDSSAMLMAFVACWATWKAIDWTPKQEPTLDFASGVFSFPSRA